MKKYFSVILILVALVLLAGCGTAGGDLVSPATPTPETGDMPLAIHFLELGNKYTGDCVFIDYGELEIIIDAGSRQSSAAAIARYIDDFIADGKIEYVIATHAHQDHISGFYSNSSGSIPGILDLYAIGTIIDFPKTNNAEDPTEVYTNYLEARENAVAKGAVHYTALDCYKNKGGARRIYELGGNAKLEIMYNYYYDNDYPGSDENNNSVCARIIQGDRQYIFTGDLEQDGEIKLVEHYAQGGGIGHCVLYKGGHHGSATSSGADLMAAISPDYVCVCTCAGSDEFRANPENVFPSQHFIDNVAPYTDRVYVTTLVTDYAAGEYESLNGDIVFSAFDDDISVEGSNNSTKLKDTEWFKANRIMPPEWSR